MSATEEKGFAVTPARLGFILSLIALVTFGWKIAAHATSQELTIQSHSEYIAEDKQNTKEILAELKDLNKKVDRLTFVLEDTKTASKEAAVQYFSK